MFSCNFQIYYKKLKYKLKDFLGRLDSRESYIEKVNYVKKVV